MYESNAIVYSPPLLHNYIKWRLKVYPNGNGNAKDHYISVFLEMGQNTTVAGAKRYEYKVEMINARMPASCVVREFASEFEGGECWGYNRFYRIDLLKKEGYLSEDDGVFKYNHPLDPVQVLCTCTYVFFGMFGYAPLHPAP
jgi:tripartite motif-containing protein 37